MARQADGWCCYAGCSSGPVQQLTGQQKRGRVRWRGSPRQACICFSFDCCYQEPALGAVSGCLTHCSKVVRAAHLHRSDFCEGTLCIEQASLQVVLSRRSPCMEQQPVARSGWAFHSAFAGSQVCSHSLCVSSGLA